MADRNEQGRFVWHDLMTPNTAGAQEFYSTTLDWSVQASEQEAAYSMFVAPSGPIGGMGEYKEGAPHWRFYAATPDLDATVRRATDLGSSVTTPATALQNGGKFAVLTDPQGATFGMYEAAQHAKLPATPGHGEFYWHELATTDNHAAFEFYSALFGWNKIAEHDMGGAVGVYLIFGLDGKQLGGIFNKGNEGRPGAAYWVGYVRVKDVHATVEKVQAARGSLLHGPAEVPGGDWVAQFTDPHGALFAALTLATDVQAGKQQDASKDDAVDSQGDEATAKDAAAKPDRVAPKANKKGRSSKPAQSVKRTGSAASDDSKKSDASASRTKSKTPAKNKQSVATNKESSAKQSAATKQPASTKKLAATKQPANTKKSAATKRPAKTKKAAPTKPPAKRKKTAASKKPAKSQKSAKSNKLAKGKKAAKKKSTKQKLPRRKTGAARKPARTGGKTSPRKAKQKTAKRLAKKKAVTKKRSAGKAQAMKKKRRLR